MESGKNHIVFLPGASGQADFWKPVGELIQGLGDQVFLGWPGFAGKPPSPGVRSLTDLVSLVAEHLDRPSTLVAQSMGGVVAVLAALANSDTVARLVLTATSGGVDVARFGALDWRPRYLEGLGEAAPRWFVDDRTDVTDRLAHLDMPTLLIFGDNDPIAPAELGRFLRSAIPNARLAVVRGGDHQLAISKSAEVARYIREFLGETGGD